MTNRHETSISVETVSSIESFLDLLPEWSVLEQSAARSSVFLTHEWLAAAWEWRCKDGQLHVLIVRNDGHLVGACPLIQSTYTKTLIKIRKLEYLVIPDSQECRVLAERGWETQVHDAIFEYLARRVDWDIAEIRQIPADSFTWQFLNEGRLPPSMSAVFRSGGSNPTVPIAGKWEDYYSRRSKRLRKGNNHIANKLKREYSDISVECRLFTTWPQDLLEDTRRDMVEMSVRSWKSKETVSSFDHDGPRAWLDKIIELAAEKGWLAVWRLELNGKCAATEMQLVRNSVVSALRADFDNDLKDLSPGAFLNWKILESLFSQDDLDADEYRMGPGTNPYKARWSETDLPLGHAFIYNSNFKGLLLKYATEWLKPKIRRIANLRSAKTTES